MNIKKITLGAMFTLLCCLSASTYAQSETTSGSNPMSCSSPTNTGLTTNQVACYGLIDSGDSFGGDADTCTSSGQHTTGCIVKTQACSSGVASARGYYDISKQTLTGTRMTSFAMNLGVTNQVVQNNILTLWVYRCDEVTNTLKITKNAKTIAQAYGVTRESALNSCNSKYDDSMYVSYSCTWGDEVILDKPYGTTNTSSDSTASTIPQNTDTNSQEQEIEESSTTESNTETSESSTSTETTPTSSGSISPNTTTDEGVHLSGSNTAPGKNYFSCAGSEDKEIENGQMICYGLIDKDDTFGGDTNLCLDSNGNIDTGCEIKVSACKSGFATATKVYRPNILSLSSSTLTSFADYLSVTNSVVKENISRLWVYSCSQAPSWATEDDNNAVDEVIDSINDSTSEASLSVLQTRTNLSYLNLENSLNKKRIIAYRAKLNAYGSNLTLDSLSFKGELTNSSYILEDFLTQPIITIAGTKIQGIISENTITFSNINVEISEGDDTDLKLTADLVEISAIQADDSFLLVIENESSIQTSATEIELVSRENTNKFTFKTTTTFKEYETKINNYKNLANSQFEAGNLDKLLVTLSHFSKYKTSYKKASYSSMLLDTYFTEAQTLINTYIKKLRNESTDEEAVEAQTASVFTDSERKSYGLSSQIQSKLDSSFNSLLSRLGKQGLSNEEIVARLEKIQTKLNVLVKRKKYSSIVQYLQDSISIYLDQNEESMDDIINGLLQD